MVTVETLIPDNAGNHLVVALTFYDENDKTNTFKIPSELSDLDIADISIQKLDLDKPLRLCAFFKMCEWLKHQVVLFPNAVFSFICSTDPLSTNHLTLNPEEYRWNLFECLYQRNLTGLIDLGIVSNDIIVGSEDYQTRARVFYRLKHSPIIHLVISHLKTKNSD